MSSNDPLSNLSLNHFTSSAMFKSSCLCLSFLMGLFFSHFCFGKGARLKSLFSMPIDDVSGRTSLQETESEEQKFRWPLYRFLVFCDHRPICLLFIVVSCLSFHSVFVMILVLCSWVLAHTLFYLWGGAGTSNLFNEIKTLWTYYWDFWLFLIAVFANVFYLLLLFK